MSTRQKEILISVMAFAIIVGGGYTFLKSTTSIGVPRNSADPFICSPLYKYPEVWACGMQQETRFIYPVKVYNGAGELIQIVPVEKLIEEMFKETKPRAKVQKVIGKCNCAQCGDLFEKTTTRQRFCKTKNPQCHLVWAKATKTAKRRANTNTKNCKTCKKDFITHIKKKLYCNDPCKNPKRTTLSPRVVECAICYKTFTTTRANSRFCGTPCDFTLNRSKKNKAQTRLRRRKCTKIAHSAESGT